MEIREIPKDSLCPEDLKGAVSFMCFCEDEDYFEDREQMVIKILKEV